MTDMKDLTLEHLYQYQKKHNIDAIIIPDGDFFLNEYTPLNDSIRKHLTQFMGSVGQAFTIRESINLIVDGRYRISAKDQFRGDLLDVVDYTPLIFPRMVEVLKDQACKNIGVWADRTNVSTYRVLQESFNVIDVQELFVSRFDLTIPTQTYFTEKVDFDLNSDEILMTHQVDMISRLTGLRSDAFPYMSSVPAVLFYSKNKMEMFSSFDLQDKGKPEELRHIKVKNLLDLQESELLKNSSFQKIVFDPQTTNQGLVNKLCGTNNLEAIEDLNSHYMNNKNGKEIKAFKESFKKSDLAIWETLNWAKESEEITEVQLKEKIIENFRGGGAWRESFHPICGFGANSAIIHYGNPSSTKNWGNGEFLLLDCGAYYEPGLATDTTRTLFRGGPSAKDVKMYSLVLRGLIKAQMAVFQPGTLGTQIDMLAREPLLQEGLNYAHGTGHGIGVHVHEAGYLLNPLSNVPMKLGQVGSIEPGYYEEGWGGIRLENAVVVQQHPKFKDMLCFEPLTKLPFEETLIDRSLFTTKELDYLDQYQAESLASLSK